jgi:SulP family sulfate permease
MPATLRGTINRIEQVTPGIHVARTYQTKWFRADLIAGVTIVALVIPQGMAYSDLAGAPPVAGLYTAFAAMIAYAFFASSPQVMVGPEPGNAILIAATLAPLVVGDPSRYVALAAMLALMVGTFLLIGGIARLAFIANFLSKPILIGYINGASLIIIASQLGQLFGIKLSSRNFFLALWQLITNLNQAKWLTFGIGLLLLALIVALRRYVPKAPSALVAIILATLVSSAFQLDTHGVAVIGHIPAGIPVPRLPAMSFVDVGALLPGAFGLALVTFADTMLTGRTFAAKNGYELDAGHELIAIGAANISSGFFQGFSCSASQSRTAANDQAGGKTQLTGIIAAALVALFLLFLSPLLQNLPQVTLAAIILVAAVGLIDVAAIQRLYRIRSVEAYLALATTLGVLVMGILPGLAAAVLLDLLVVIWMLAHPHDTVLGVFKGIDGYHGISSNSNNQTEPGLIAYRFDAPLFFGNADYFLRQVRTLVHTCDPPLQWFLLDAEGIHTLDSTAAEMLRTIILELQHEGIVFAIARANTVLRKMLTGNRLTSLIGPEHFYPTVTTGVRAYREHLAEQAQKTDAPTMERADG